MDIQASTMGIDHIHGAPPLGRGLVGYLSQQRLPCGRGFLAEASDNARCLEVSGSNSYRCTCRPCFAGFWAAGWRMCRTSLPFTPPIRRRTSALWLIPLPLRVLPRAMTTAPPPSALSGTACHCASNVALPALMPTPTWPLPLHSPLASMALPDRSSHHPSSQVM